VNSVSKPPQTVVSQAILATLLVCVIAVCAAFVWHSATYAPAQKSLRVVAQHKPKRPAPHTPIYFVEVARSAGLRYQWTIPNPGPHNVLESIGNGCAFLDYDNDGRLDILLVGPKLALYRGNGKGHFTDVTTGTGLEKLSGHFLGCAVGDYDNDGYDDLYISGYKTGLLLHNEGGHRFKDVTAQAGLKPQPFGTTCAFGSFDGSRYLDLFICNYVKMVRMDWRSAANPALYPPLSSVLYHNLDGRHFVETTTSWNAKTLSGRGLGAAYAPIDKTNRVGLAVANDMGLSDLFVRATPTSLRNVGSPSGVSSPAERPGLNGRMGIDWGDYDNDGLLDLFITTYEFEPKILLHNLGDGVFQDVGQSLSDGNVLEMLAWGCKWLDADNSGWLDLLVTNGHLDNTGVFRGPHVPYRQPTLLLYNQKGKGLIDASDTTGLNKVPPVVGRGLAIGDYDNDGRVDALVVDSEGSPQLLHNESHPCGHWIVLQLTGVRSNRDGYGTLITVTAGGLTQTRLCHADGSYLSSSDKRVSIGLGKATVASRIVIQWPSGQTDVLHDVPADRLLFVREGGKWGREPL